MMNSLMFKYTQQHVHDELTEFKRLVDVRSIYLVLEWKKLFNYCNKYGFCTVSDAQWNEGKRG